MVTLDIQILTKLPAPCEILEAYCLHDWTVQSSPLVKDHSSWRQLFVDSSAAERKGKARILTMHFMTFTFYWRINAFTECVEVNWKFFWAFFKRILFHSRLLDNR